MALEVVHKIRAIGGLDTYTTLEAWEADQNRDLVAADEIAVAEVYDDWVGGLPTSVAISDWTTDETRKIIIRAAAGHGHNGDPTTGALITTSANNGAIKGTNGYTLIGLRFTDNVAVTNNGIVRGKFIAAGEHGVIDCCIFFGTNGDSYAVTATQAVPAYFTVRNCLVLNLARGFYALNNATDAHYYNNTIVGCSSLGISNGISTNNFVYGSAAGDYNTVNIVVNTSASSDTTGTVGMQNKTSAEFLDYAGGDYRLSATTTLEDVGTDMTATDPLFNYDIVGDTRVTWDLGAYAVVSAGGVITLTLNSLNSDISTQVPTLTQANILNLGMLSSLTNITNVLLNVETTLTIDSAALLSTLGSVGLTQSHILAIIDLVSDTSTGAILLLQNNILSVDTLSGILVTETPTLTQGSNLNVANVDAEYDVSVVTFTQAGILALSSLHAATELEGITFSQGLGLNIAGIEEVVIVTTPTLTQQNILNLDGLISLLVEQSIDLIQDNIIGVGSMEQLMISEEITLDFSVFLALDTFTVSTGSLNVGLIQGHTLQPLPVSIQEEISNIITVQSHVILVHSLEEVSLNSHTILELSSILAVNSPYIAVEVGLIDLVTELGLLVDNAKSAITFPDITLQSHVTIAVSSILYNYIADNITLFQGVIPLPSTKGTVFMIKEEKGLVFITKG